MKKWLKIIIIILLILLCVSVIYGAISVNNKDAECDSFSIQMPHDYSVISTSDRAISIENNQFTSSIFKINKLNDNNTTYIKTASNGEFVNGSKVLSTNTLDMASDNFTNFTIQRTEITNKDEYQLYAEFVKDDVKYSITRTYTTENSFNQSADSDLGTILNLAVSIDKK